MNNLPEEELEKGVSRLRILSGELGLFLPVSRYTVTATLDGKVLDAREGISRSWNRNAYNWLGSQLQGVARTAGEFGAGVLNMKQTAGTITTTSVATLTYTGSVEVSYGYVGIVDSSTRGIVVGRVTPTPHIGTLFTPSNMTAVNLPSPYVVTATVSYETSDWAKWKAFDEYIESTPTGGMGWYVNSVPARIVIDLGTTHTCCRYRIYSANSSYCPRTWTLEGSNTGAFAGEQTVIDTRTSIPVWTINTYNEYSFAESSAYRYYSMNITATSASNVAMIGQIELYGDGVAINPGEVFDDYILSDKIASGTGADTLSYQASSSPAHNYDPGSRENTITWSRYFNNNSPGTINVGEIGIYAYHSGGYYYMVCRDLFDPVIELPPSTELYVEYIISLTYPG